MKKQQLTGHEEGYWFIAADFKVWMPNGEIPVGTAADFNLIGATAQCIGTWQGKTAWFVMQKRPDNMSKIRSLLTADDDQLFFLAGKAIQLSEFYRSHKFCGYCGHLMHHSTKEWCCLCSHCHERYYPQIAPSIIVAIRRHHQILLAHHIHHRQEELYTVLAGFVEVGETVEHAVQREVYEEAHIKIKNIRYVASQPWPFPNSMMLAFLADYDSGEIAIDTSELIDAKWYHYNELPKIPSYGTVARRLIEETVALCRQSEETESPS